MRIMAREGMRMSAVAKALLLSGLCLVAPSLASAQSAPAQIPKGWSYQVDSRGNRIARNNRVVKPDGSWREEIRQGNCVTIKERSATGEYRETRQCNPSPK
jgi:hypothetical protein